MIFLHSGDCLLDGKLSKLYELGNIVFDSELNSNLCFSSVYQVNFLSHFRVVGSQLYPYFLSVFE